ncbi:MAG TPA: ABC transporter substrate-binding protein [Chloroflexota bacterium]
MRRLPGLLLLLLLAACGAAAPVTSALPSAATLSKLTASYSEPVPQELPAWLPKEAGLFEKNGLDVDLKYVASTQAITALVAGEVVIGNTGGPSILNAVAGGADLVVPAVPLALSPFQIYSPPGINSMSDLKGKAVGVSRFGGQSDTEMRIALKAAGLDAKADVRFVETGDAQATTAALLQGTVQAAAQNPASAPALQKAGLHPIFDLGTSKEPVAEQVVVAKRDWLTQHRDVMQRYVDATVEGMQRQKQDKALSVSILKKYLKSDDDAAMSETYDTYLKLWPALPTPKAEQFTTIRDIAAASNPNAAKVDLDKLVDASYVADAQKRGLGGS